MDESEISYNIESEEQLWDEIQQVVQRECAAESHELIDDALRNWLYLASRCREDFSQSEDDVALCSEKLLAGTLFRANPDYVRTQIIYSLLQEDDAGPLYAIATFLLLDGRKDEDTYRRMVSESCFCRLLELINGRKQSDPGLHRLLLELMYEMSRIEQLRYKDLLQVDDDFVMYLFQLIEELSDDAHDPYHYPIIRVLLVMNEQYMVASTTTMSETNTPLPPLTNRVVKCLSLYGDHYRTFGENIILLLNRETETSMQLLILKLLYLLFTTKATYEYFYTNDLRVLLDVIIRNLLDLPNELMSLRHTYLRVLYPLLAHTQLSNPPHYKKAEISKTMQLLAGADNFHFAPADETTLRLVGRVNKVKWLADEGSGSSEIARKLLGISLSRDESSSNISVVDVAAVTEKPGVQTPSRKAEASEHQAGDQDSGAESSTTQQSSTIGSALGRRPKRPLPELPKHRHGSACAPVVMLNGAAGESVITKLPPKAPPPRRTGRLKATMPSPPRADSPLATTIAPE